MSRKFYAHSLKGKPREEWQELEEHLRNVAARAKIFASEFGAGEWGYVAGMMHDVGKYSKEFQDMLTKSINEDANDEQRRGPDHSSAGAQEAIKRFKEGIGKLLAYCIAGHHAGLLDSNANGACLRERLDKRLKDYSTCPENILEIPNITKLPISFNKNKNDIGFQLQFFVRMLFSCLVDADFLDTEAFIDRKKSQSRSNNERLVSLRDKVVSEVNRISSNDTAVNRVRRQVFEQCLKSTEDKPGIFSLTVPTGGGKTLSSLAFALEHAIKYGMQRVIYVIPYTSIIEQNAEVFRNVCGNAAVLEHHCNFEFAQDSYKTQLAAENWDAPIIVTTNVQFFETLFNYRVSKCRKAHNIANSVIIFDEAQMLSVDLLKPCLAVIKELVRNYCATIVLSTATQPALNFSEEFKIGIGNVKEIVENPEELYQALRRVSVQKLSPMKNIELASHINKYRQVLCMVNTRKYARQLYEAIINREGLYHLSALMCPAHRSETIAHIKTALKEGDPCRVISTQLIEAGVDVDFPVVFRASAGIDSIAQSAGRCNREGRLPEGGKVFVFIPENPSPPGFLRQSAEAGESIMRRYQDMISLTAVEDYFRELYWREELERSICWPVWEDLAGAKIVFRLDGKLEYVHDSSAVKKAWLKYYDREQSGYSAFCLVTGMKTSIARLHNSIKGVKDAQSTGADIVSCNLDAFKSYNKDQSYNSPIGEEAMFNYTTTLNHLLRRESRQKIQIGDATTVFWAEGKTPVLEFLKDILDPRENIPVNFARSIEPVVPLEVSITRMAVTTEKEAKDQSGDNRTMGRKHIVPYGLYRVEGYVSAFLAQQTGFNDGDLNLLWQALINMFDHDHSAARGKMNARKLIVFKHDTELGSAPAHKLFDLIKVTRTEDLCKPARAYTDYKVEVSKQAPNGITVEEKL